MGGEWDDLAGWWVDEAAADPAFTSDVLPLTLELLEGVEGPMLDLGCGEGRVMRAVGGRGRTVVGVDVTMELAIRAAASGPVVRGELPHLDWMASEALGGVYAVLVIEHIADVDALFREARRVVRAGGCMVIVANHPLYTAEGAAPIIDSTDGEVLWRWGRYFTAGAVATEIMGGATVTFHHRPLGALVTAAATAGWTLESLVERPLSAGTIARMPGYEGQEDFPRLAGFRWRNPADWDARPIASGDGMGQAWAVVGSTSGGVMSDTLGGDALSPYLLR